MGRSSRAPCPEGQIWREWVLWPGSQGVRQLWPEPLAHGGAGDLLPLAPRAPPRSARNCKPHSPLSEFASPKHGVEGSAPPEGLPALVFLRGLSDQKHEDSWGGGARRGGGKRRAQEGTECGLWDVSGKADLAVTPCAHVAEFGGEHLELGGGGQRACPD